MEGHNPRTLELRTLELRTPEPSNLLLMRNRLIILFLTLFLPLLVPAQKKKFRLPPDFVEVSGLQISTPDSIWWHNDGGDRPRLLLTDGRGRVRQRIALPGIQNRDWEDISADPSGRLYIGDFGNNLNRRTDLRIYLYQPGTQRIDSILFAYPDQRSFAPPLAQWNFDVEGFFWFRDSLHLFTKNRLVAGNYYTKHYVLPAKPGQYAAILRDSILLPKRVVTAAAVRPDGKQIALLSYFYRMTFLGLLPKTRTSIWTFTDFPGTNFFKGTMTKTKVHKPPLIPTQYESLDYVSEQRVLIASERTIMFKPKAKQIKLKKVEKLKS